MITEWLTPEKINIVNSVKDWKEAVILCSQPLLLQNFISPEYIDVIFTTHEELGPYYVIAPGLALPHARPEQGVIKTGLSLLHVKEGVFFGSHANDPVYVIIMMCAISGNEHINLISSLAEIFSDEDKLSRLINASTSFGFYSQQSFNRSFKRQFGQSPGAWRRQVQDPIRQLN